MKMTSNLIRNLLRRKATRDYPARAREPFPQSRGELYNEIDKCIFCGLCQRKCPSQCITVDKDSAVWTCDPFACVYCGTCEEVCPVDCLHHKPTWRPVSREREVISMQGRIKNRKKKA